MTITAAMVKTLRERTGAPMLNCKKALEEAQGDPEKAIDILRKSGEAMVAKRAGKIAAEGGIFIAVRPDQKCAFMIELNCETDFVARETEFVALGRSIAERGLAAGANDVATTLALPIQSDGTVSIDETRKALISKIGENVQLRRVALIESDGVVGHYCHSQRIGVLVAMMPGDSALGKEIAMHIVASNPQAVSVNDVSPEAVAREKEIFLAQAQNLGKPANVIEKMVNGRLAKFLKEVSLLDQPFFKDSELTVAQVLEAKKAKVQAFIRYELGEGIEKEVHNFADEVMSQVQGRD